MKKIILFLFIIVSLGRLMAQDESGGPNYRNPYLGVKFGYGIVEFKSSVKDVNNFAEITYNNLSYGVVAGYNITGRISIQLEGNYAQYSARNIIPTYLYSPQSPLLQTYNSNSTVDRVDIQLYNIDVPLLVQVSLKDYGLTPYIYGGLNLGINISGRSTIVRKIVENGTSYREYRDDITERIIYNEFAPVFGVGIKKNSGNISLFGDVRYKYGYENLSNVDNDLGFTSSALWISAGIIYNL